MLERKGKIIRIKNWGVEINIGDVKGSREVLGEPIAFFLKSTIFLFLFFSRFFSPLLSCPGHVIVFWQIDLTAESGNGRKIFPSRD